MTIQLDRNKPADFQCYLENLQASIERGVKKYQMVSFLHDETNNDSYGTVHYNANTPLGISDVSKMRASSMRQLLSDELFNGLGISNQCVQYMPGSIARDLLYKAMGRKFYWRDLMNSSTTIEAWANHWINKTTTISVYPYTKILVSAWESHTKFSVILKGHEAGSYCSTCGHHYSLPEMNNDFYNEYYPCEGELTGCYCTECNTPKVVIALKKMETSIYRNRVRAIEQATQEGTLKRDNSGLLLYPVEIWAKQQLGHYAWGTTNNVVCRTIRYYDGSLHDVCNHDVYATSFVKLDGYIRFTGTCDKVDCRYSDKRDVTPPHNTYF